MHIHFPNTPNRFNETVKTVVGEDDDTKQVNTNGNRVVLLLLSVRQLAIG
jgi:hypothetical protein